MKKAINHQIMRSNNKRQILDLIRKSPPLTKKAIADKLGISVTSVSSFLMELLNEERILCSGNAASTGGRKSELYHLNPDFFYVIGVDLQVDRIITLLINLKGEILKSEETHFTQNDEWHVSSLIYNSLLQVCQSAQIPYSKVAGVGIGVPGIVDYQSGVIEFAPNLGWRNVNLASLLPTDLPIKIENEANAAAVGEVNFGSAQGRANVIFVSVGLGIGTGLIMNHNLFYGHNFLAGEFGHMTIIPNGLTCRCGKKGCWEVYASNEAALKLYARYSGERINSYDRLLELFLKNNPFAIKAMEETVSYLGLGIANLVNGLNPEMIVIGGKIAEAENLIYHRLLKEIKENCFEYSYRGVSFQFSSLKNYATALGAGNLVIDSLIHL